MEDRAYIAVVDDDESVRESLPDLLRVFGHEAETFSSAEEFLGSRRIDKTKCLVLDIAMPGMSGIELQRELTRQGRKIPIVFITITIDLEKDKGSEEIEVDGRSQSSLLRPMEMSRFVGACVRAEPSNVS